MFRLGPSSDAVVPSQSRPGVRREGVTEAAGSLQQDGLISYRRGHITVLDRAGLERRTCECYAVAKKEYRAPASAGDGAIDASPAAACKASLLLLRPRRPDAKAAIDRDVRCRKDARIAALYKRADIALRTRNSWPTLPEWDRKPVARWRWRKRFSTPAS